MLKQGCVADIKRGKLNRESGYLAITMRFYPRFLRKELRDEFLCELAPVRELLHDFNSAQRRLGKHNESFAECDYQHRFSVSTKGWAHLARLAALSRTRDVYLVCVCANGEMCHREILMLIAEKVFGCEIGEVYHQYPTVLDRLPELLSTSEVAPDRAWLYRSTVNG